MRGRARPAQRRGMLMVMALVVLILVGLLAATFARGLVLARRQSLLTVRGAQAHLLADSGVARAQALLARDPSYAGELWEVPAAELAGPDSARVTIKVEATEEPPLRRRVSIVAEFPAGATLCARSSRQIHVDVRQSPKGEQP